MQKYLIFNDKVGSGNIVKISSSEFWIQWPNNKLSQHPYKSLEEAKRAYNQKNWKNERNIF